MLYYCIGLYKGFDLSTIIYNSTRSFYLNCTRELLEYRYSPDDEYYADVEYGGGSLKSFEKDQLNRVDYEEFLRSQLRPELNYLKSRDVMKSIPKHLQHLVKKPSDMGKLLKKNRSRLRQMNDYIAFKAYWRAEKDRERHRSQRLMDSMSAYECVPVCVCVCVCYAW